MTDSSKFFWLNNMMKYCTCYNEISQQKAANKETHLLSYL